MRWSETGIRGDEYEARFQARAAAGHDIHGEADFVRRLGAGSVLDAGCGTGRVGRELARHGIDVVGVDRDADMLSTARAMAPHLAWHLGDLASIDLARTFDAVVLAGNVMIFLDPGSEGSVLANLTRHLVPGGLLIAGFQLRDNRLSLSQYDAAARAAGLVFTARWATWDQAPWEVGGDYAVSVHMRPVGG